MAAPRKRIPSTETRAKILAASRRAFSRAGFDQLGVRELAEEADVDPAIVIRLFGSKEALFAAVARTAFALEPPFAGPIDGARIAHVLTGKTAAAPDDGFDEFAFLMRSAASPIAAPILAAALHAGFVAPLAEQLGGKEASQRAMLLTACVLGFSTLRYALGMGSLDAKARKRFGAVLQACLD
ncbi:MAG TPA: TetR family transcriptional regulator [Kofleriaceae bacterium]